MKTLFPYLNAQAGREGVSVNALVYLVGGLLVLGGFAWWAHVSTTPKPRVFGVTPSALAVYASATPDTGWLPAIVFGPSPTPEREIRPYGYLGDTVIGPARTPTPTSTGDNLELEIVTQPTITPTPFPTVQRQSIEPFKVYIFAAPEVQNQIIVEYPYLVLTHQALPPGVSILEAGLASDETFPTRQALRYGDAHLPPYTPTPVPSATLRPYQVELMATVQAWESVAPAAAALAVGAAERFSGAAPLAHSVRIQRVP